ncbi:COP9 signalosome complex subunit 7-like protein isoform X1 [Tanacetum coccineum]
MDIEEKQAEHIDHFVKKASILNGATSAVVNVIVEATSHPALFAFSEILQLPNVLQLQGTEHSIYLDLLQMFAHGTWSGYKSNASSLPQLTPDQALKLKQLTMLTLAEANKVLPYDVLMQELDVVNVRELEDFLINECMYVGIVRGKLDQQRRCFEVQFAAGRDLRPGQLGNMIHTLSDWLGTSDNLLITIQEKIKWADTMSELDKKHKKENEERLEEAKNVLSLKSRVGSVGKPPPPSPLETEVKGSILTPYKAGGPLEAASLPLGRDVTTCEQADFDFQGQGHFAEPGGVMEFNQDRRSKRYSYDVVPLIPASVSCLLILHFHHKKNRSNDVKGDDIRWAEGLRGLLKNEDCHIGYR